MGQGALVLFSAPEFIRNGDVHHEYRQDSDFFYLTGLDEPQSALVIIAGANPKFVLFVRERDEAREIWDGPRTGTVGAREVFGADESHCIDELAKLLPRLISGHSRLYHRFAVVDAHDGVVMAALREARVRHRRELQPTEMIDAGAVLHPMRWRKSESELTSLRRAIEITGDAHLAAMRAAPRSSYEYELEAELRRVFRAAGSERSAYAPIVGSGPNATILHHIRNDRKIEDGDLVLIDAGCEYEYCAADITRTFPANGKFTDAQRRIYDLVLRAQHAAFDAIKPGATLDDVHAASLHTITEGLIELGFIEGPLELALSEARYAKYFMHRTGHYLGMDVHDVAPVTGKPATFAPGVVITVEPGVYVPNNDDTVPAEYRGIGVRIEDDALVTDHGYENLSKAIPTDASEIETLMAS